MSKETGISWTDSTWNPVRGCTRVSEGCRHCFAEAIAARFSGPGQPYEGLATSTPGGPRWTGKVRFIDAHLKDPLKWKEPAKIFVNSMSDLFHEGLRDDEIDQVFAVMALCPQHTFQVLTKRPGLMMKYLDAAYADLERWERAAMLITGSPALSGMVFDTAVRNPLPNVWLGVSAEDQEAADARIPKLMKTRAAVRFVSAEPLLGPIEFRKAWWPTDRRARLDWLIVGGESGPGFREMDMNAAGDLCDQCRGAGVAFFMKQDSGSKPGQRGRIPDYLWSLKQFPS